MLTKQFDIWNSKKKKLDENRNGYLFKEKEIWWCSVGENVAKEVNGKGEMFRRPVCILKKLSDELFVALPLSSKKKTGSWFEKIETKLGTETVLLYQIRMLSTNRLHVRMATIDETSFCKIKEKLKTLLELF